MLFNISIYLTLLAIQVSCEQEPSLAFLIDDTWASMSDFYKVKSYANQMLNMILAEIPIGDKLVLTFNSSDITSRTLTEDRRLFKKALDLIDVHSGDECRGIGLSGIKQGLNISQNGAYAYVFTEAYAEDYGSLDEVKTLCLEKKSKIFFILTGNCQTRNPQLNEVYNNITLACGGEVIQLNINELDKTFQYLRESIKVVKNVIKSTQIVPSKTTEVKFNKRESNDYMFVSASGSDVELMVLDEERNNIGNHVVWLRNLKAFKLEHVSRGEVTVRAKCRSAGHVSIFGHTPVPQIEEDTKQNIRRYHSYTYLR